MSSIDSDSLEQLTSDGKNCTEFFLVAWKETMISNNSRFNVKVKKSPSKSLDKTNLISEEPGSLEQTSSGIGASISASANGFYGAVFNSGKRKSGKVPQNLTYRID